MLRPDVCVFLFLCLHGASGAVTSPTITSVPKNPTCPFRTINYLTHTLPKQCLASARAGSRSDQADTRTITSPATPSTSLHPDHSSYDSEHSTQHESNASPSSVSPSTVSISSASLLTTSVTSVTTISAISFSSTSSLLLPPKAADEDSPLESSNFLSFEEWKKQNLVKGGHSEHSGRNGKHYHKDLRKRSENVDNSLDALGDDAEIDLDFSGLVPGGPETGKEYASGQMDKADETLQAAENTSAPKGRGRSKDAGTTCKQRSNYASFDCAASVLKSNAEAKNANLVLRENKDLYLLNKCSASDKHFILELCEDIAIDTIVLANFEFFSSSFRTFRVSISNRYPVKLDKWKDLGTFEARNTREVQAFLVENPVDWARYVKIEFLTHYGSEFYCPVSLVRVHGTTMFEEWKQTIDMSMEEEEETTTEISTDTTEDAFVPEAVDEALLIEKQTSVAATLQAPPRPIVASGAANGIVFPATTNVDTSTQNKTTCLNELFAVQKLLLAELEGCSVEEDSAHRTCDADEEILIDIRDSTALSIPLVSSSVYDNTKNASLSRGADATDLSSVGTGPVFAKTGSARLDSQTVSNISKSSDEDKQSTTRASSVDLPKADAVAKETTRLHTTRQTGSGTQPQPASPTMQESFFKSVQKRLQMLESNSSLSLLYIEEQSRALRDAFQKVEQRQLSKTSAFLDNLNQTVLNELREFRQQYDHLWQATVIELEVQRERYQQESRAMNARLGVLADELIFQRRVSILQMVLILASLGLVLFSRGTLNTYLELPLVQSVLSKSPRSRWTSMSGDSRTASPAISRTRSPHQMRSPPGILKTHKRGVSEDSHNELFGASDIYSPPTPISFDGYSDIETIKTEIKMEDPEFDPINIERPSTSPPMLQRIKNIDTPVLDGVSAGASIDSNLSDSIRTVDKTQHPQVEIERPTPLTKHLTWNLPA